MRISIAISLLIVAVAVLMGWGEHRKLEGLREEHAALREEAGRLGIFVADAGKQGGALLVTKRTRHGEAEASQAALLAAREILAFAREMETNKRDGKPLDVAMRQRLLEKIEQLQSLDAGQLGILLGEFRSASGIDHETRRGLVSFAIQTLAKAQPKTALELFLKDPDLREIGALGEGFLASTLKSWAGENSAEALRWLRANESEHPGFVTDEVRAALVTGTSTQNMGLAFSLVREFGLDKPGDALAKIATSANSPEKRTEFLRLLREHKVTMPGKDIPDGVVATLASGIGQDGYDSGSRWLAQGKLTPEELTRMADFIVITAKDGEQGKWIGWMGENLPSDVRDKKVSASMENWTQKDHRAAGEWLVAAPAGEGRNAAVKGFVGAVAAYDPQVAAQWAITLPTGQDRESSLRKIHDAMPEKTPVEKAAREVFKAQHGIK